MAAMEPRAGDRRRVLHVYKDYYPPVFGGIEQTINLMAEGLGGEWDARVLVCAGNSPAGRERINGVEVVRVKEWGRALSAPLCPAFHRALRREAADADVLHFHHPNPSGDLAYFLARVRKPAVMTYHSDIVRQRVTGFLISPLQRAMMRSCQVIMPTSPNYIESSAWLREFREKCRVVPLGIRLERFERTAEVDARAREIRARHPGRIVLFVGRLRYYKGLEFLIHAMEKVDARAIIVGTGKDGERLRGLAAASPARERIHFAGDLTDEDVVAHLHAAEVFCMPSHLRSEAFGVSLVEAMACGLPLVTARLDTGVTFVNQDGVTGLCVEPASAEAVAEGLNRLLGDAALRRTMGESARSRARAEFSAEVMCGRLAQVYRDVLAGVGAGAV